MYNFMSKKRMKFNKFTHLTVILVLAIVFIVVYLYYTIRDVKKIHNEVTKLTSDLGEVNKSISNITTLLVPMLKSNPKSQVGNGVENTEQCVNVQGDVSCAYPSHNTLIRNKHTENVVSTTQDEEVESSVNSQELKEIMETIDDEDQTKKEDIVNDVGNLKDVEDIEEMVEEQNVSQYTLKEASRTLDITSIGDAVTELTETPETTEDLSVLSVEDLKKVSYEQIRKYCKNNGVSFKGTKDVLIYRIKGIKS